VVQFIAVSSDGSKRKRKLDCCSPTPPDVGNSNGIILNMLYEALKIMSIIQGKLNIKTFTR